MIDFENKNKANIITRNATYTALYVALCFLLAPFSYGSIQVRVAESLTILALFDPHAVISITLGCFLSNLFMSNIYDIVFGTFATFIGLFFIRKIKINNFFAKMFPTIISNAIIIPFVLKYGYKLNDIVLYMEFIFIAVGEIISVYGIGFVLYKSLCALKKKK